jgi:hypothetical protein
VIRLWLDDVRLAPEGWTHVRSVNEAIAILRERAGEVAEMSLDHDLGDFAEDGGDGVRLVLWMAEHDVWPPVVRVHSMNPVGRANMEALIRRYKDGRRS